MSRAYLKQEELDFLSKKKNRSKYQLNQLKAYVGLNIEADDIKPRGYNPIDLRPSKRVKSYK